MKYEMTRDDLYAINQIAESLNSRNASDDDSSDYYIYWPLLELVKTALTESARDKSQVVQSDPIRREVLHDEDELGEAIRIVADRVNQYLRDLDLKVDLELYFDWIKKKLEWPAKTITGKGDLLRIEKEQLSVATGLVINLSHGIQADLTKIGMADSVEGLYLKPKTLSDRLNLDALRSRGDCEVVGNWYPYDVQGPNGLAFVVDDDHSIFVSTRGMDEITQAECQTVLIEIANMLFAT